MLKRTLLLIVVAAALLLALGGQVGAEPAGGSLPPPSPAACALGWQDEPAFGPQRYLAGAAASLAANRFYYIGGAGVGNSFLSSTTYLDLSSPVPGWLTGQPLPLARSEFGSALVAGSIFVAGGRNASGVLTDVHAYVVASDQWYTATGLPEPTGGAAAANLADNFYLLGGYHASGSGFSTSTYVYSYANALWSSGPPLPLALSYAAAATLSDTLYVAGGQNATGYLNSLYAYNGAGGWQVRASMPFTVARGALSIYNGRLLYTGGYNGSRLVGTYLYDPAGDSWTAGPPLPAPRIFHSQATLADRVLISGGATDAGLTNSTLSLRTTCPTTTPSSTPPASSTPTSSLPTASATISPLASSTPTSSLPTASATTSPLPSGTRTPSSTPTIGSPTATEPPAATFTAPVPATGTPCANFSDVPASSVFYDYIRLLTCYGSVSGYLDGRFHPGYNVTRAEIAKIFVLTFNLPRQTPLTPSYSDVATTHWAYAFIETAYTGEALRGYPATTCERRGLPAGRSCFLPNEPMRRAELAVMVVRARSWPDTGWPLTPSYSDVPPSHWAYPYVEKANRYRVISGNEGRFRPNDYLRRDELCKVLYLSCAADGGPCSNLR